MLCCLFPCEQYSGTAYAEPVAVVGCDPASLSQPLSPSRAEHIHSARKCLLCSGLTPSLATLHSTLCSLAGRGIPPTLLSSALPHSDLQDEGQGLP